VSISDLDQEFVGRIAGPTLSCEFLHLANGNGRIPEGQERLELRIADSSHVSSSGWILQGPQLQRTATWTRTMTLSLLTREERRAPVAP
jgi:hypothetical protein